MIHKDGFAKCYCYPNGEANPTEIIDAFLYTSEEMEEFYNHMYDNYDAKGNWSCYLLDVENN